MKVKELIKELLPLDQEQEIRYDSYEFIGDFRIDGIVEIKNENEKYYNIVST